MKVLKSWNEVGNAVNSLKMADLPLHNDPAKCWDFYNIRNLLLKNDIPQQACIVDFGCGSSIYGAITLEFLRAMGYKNLLGIDLHIPLYARLAALIRGWIKFRDVMPYRMMQGDITSTTLTSNSVDVAILLSVVEHGLDLDKLFCHLSKIVKPGGLIYLSTDYWDQQVEMSLGLVASGARNNEPLPWKIFDSALLLDLRNIAKKYGVCAKGDENSTSCEDQVVYWQGVKYTFVALEFEKCSDSR